MKDESIDLVAKVVSDTAQMNSLLNGLSATSTTLGWDIGTGTGTGSGTNAMMGYCQPLYSYWHTCKDKSRFEQAFKVLRALIDAKAIKVESVKAFIDTVDLIQKSL